jgi:hypothetical protein
VSQLLPVVLLTALLLSTSSARGEFIDSVHVRGARRTRDETISTLLPRPPPANYERAELDDFARRLGNLAIFDDVKVTLHGATLDVTVREKWTLIPELALGTGKTAADLSLDIGATEYNVLGLGTELGATLYRKERGLGFVAWLSEHSYRLSRWSRGASLEYTNVSSRFDDGQTFRTVGPRVSGWLKSPPVVSRFLRYQLAVRYQREDVRDAQGGAAAPSGHGMLLGAGLSYDRYHWHDLVPRGGKLSVNLGPGFFMPSAQPRHFLDFEAKAALPLVHQAVLALRVKAALCSRGNPNASSTLGSVEGVRGLPDALYRNWAQVFVNVELRQAVRLLERVALQAVLFADVAEFQRMTAAGKRGEQVFAASLGAGARVLPTFLAQAALRVDLARLLAPRAGWLPQLGLTQYF